MQRKSSMMDKVSIVAFVLSVAAVGFGYGYLSHRDNLFPQPLLREAVIALDALWDVREQLGGASKPASFASLDESVTGGPNVRGFDQPADRPADQQDGDWILIVGGPYEYLERCPTFGCLAWVIDRAGKVVHSWEVDLDALWANAEHLSGLMSAKNFKPQHVELLADGSIIAMFWNEFAFPSGAGLAKFDMRGNLLWTNLANGHHWFTTDPAGRIYLPTHAAVEAPFRLGNTKVMMRCEEGQALIDGIAVVTADGRTVEEIPLYDILIDNGYAGLIERTEFACDPLHLNFVEYVKADVASRVEGLEAGDLLVSMRNISTLALLDPAARKIKWLISGATFKQHSPRFLPDGTFVVFDNFGGDRAFGGSRITRHRVFDGAVETVFPKAAPQGGPFDSEYAGHIAVHPSGERLLASLTQKGTVWEISLKTGKAGWIYDKVFPAKGYPGAEEDAEASVRVEAFGAAYVDRALFSAAMAADAGN